MTSLVGRASVGPSVAGALTRQERTFPWLRLVFGAISVALLVYGAWTVARLEREAVLGYFGLDRRIYMVAAERWLAGGSFYEPYQLIGPYPIDRFEILYPPVLLIVLVPFTFLPASLWWGIPLGLTAWALLRLRPAPAAWPLLAACLVWPPTITHLLTGNPAMWALAALSLGVVYAGPAVFVLIKPSLAPFALWGLRHRRWWLYLLAFAALSVPFGVLWLDWLTALANSQGGGLLYSINDVPLLLIPVIAWLARSGSLRSRSPRERPIQSTIGTQRSGIAPRL